MMQMRLCVIHQITGLQGEVLQVLHQGPMCSLNVWWPGGTNTCAVASWDGAKIWVGLLWQPPGKQGAQQF